MTTHHRQSMRAFLAMADEAGALTRIAERVDPVHEIAAWLSLLDGRGPVVFENVAGHAMAVTGNHLTTRAQAARAVGVETDRLQARLVDAVRSRSHRGLLSAMPRARRLSCPIPIWPPCRSRRSSSTRPDPTLPQVGSLPGTPSRGTGISRSHD